MAIGTWCRVYPGEVLKGIKAGEKFDSDGRVFTVHYVEADGSVVGFSTERDQEGDGRYFGRSHVTRVA